MIFRVHFKMAMSHPHVYCRVFAAPIGGETFSQVGWMTLRKPEFAALKKAFDAEFVDKSDDPKEDVGSPPPSERATS